MLEEEKKPSATASVRVVKVVKSIHQSTMGEMRWIRIVYC